MGVRVQPVAEKRFNVASAKLPRRQTDVMDHQQRNRDTVRARTIVGGRTPATVGKTARGAKLLDEMKDVIMGQERSRYAKNDSRKIESQSVWRCYGVMARVQSLRL